MIVDTIDIRSTAPKASRYRRYVTPQLKTHFVGPGHLIALCGAMLVLAVLLFPRAFIDQQLRAEGQPQAATIAYLQLLVNAQPSNETVRLQLVHERLRAGQLAEAEVALAPLAHHAGLESAKVASLWLSLRRAQFVAIPPGSAAREEARRAYAHALERLGRRLSPAGQLAETRHAIDAGLYVTAARLATHLLMTAPTRSRTGAAEDRHGTDRATAVSMRVEPRGSTSRSALHHDFTDTTERLVGLVWASRAAGGHTAHVPIEARHIHQQAFDALLQSHLAAGQPDEALQAAQEYLPSLDPARVDWTRLMQIASWANRPSAAANFAQHWLAIAGDDNTRWTAFQAMIQAYLSAGQPRQALTAAVANLHWIPPSTALWRNMTRLAMQAGDAGKSVQYARRLVGLGTPHVH